MFDVGFWELCLVGVVSLLVIGPEKLPKLARIVGFWVGKTRHVVASVKEEIKEELKEEELRQLLKEQQEQLDVMTKDLDLHQRAEHFLDAKDNTDKKPDVGK
ncbi:MAG: Sec-independent protein translocase protein TatB [Methylococcaceae bacterium]|nr:Sec-independent protein translocase protein TatB [Methylococcaceae bacterium]